MVVDAAFKVHSSLGPGLLESAYETLLAYELAKRGVPVLRQTPIVLQYDGQSFGDGFRADLLIGGAVIIEVKSVEVLLPVHKRQVLTYLRLSGMRLGLLINFGAVLLKDGVTRVVNGLPDSRG